MTTIFSAISAKIFGGLLIASLAFNVWTQLQLSGARKALGNEITAHSQTKKDLAVSQASITGWATIAAERRKTADVALKAAQGETVIHVDRAKQIMQMPVPTPDKECVGTLELLKARQ